MWFLNVRTVFKKFKWKLKMTKGGGGLRWDRGKREGKKEIEREKGEMEEKRGKGKG